jgi:hypothetical protein
MSWMRFVLLLSALLAWSASAQPVSASSAPVRRRIQVIDFSSADEPSLAQTVTKLLTVELSHRNYDVLSSRDLAAAANVEADRQAAGCDSTSCLMEIAEAMGADLLAYGDVVRLNKTLLVTLNVFDAKAGKAVGRDQLKVADLDALPDAVAASLNQLLGETAPAPVVATPTAGPSLAPVVTIAGASVGVVGLVSAVLAYGANGDKASTTESKNTAIAVWPWALGALGVGATAAAAGTVMWVME